MCSIIDTICESPLVHSSPLQPLFTLFKTPLKTPLESIQRSPYGLGKVLEFADDYVKVTLGVLGVLEKGGPHSRRFGYFCL